MSFSTADLSWVKLMRHDYECAECRQIRRKENNQQVAAGRLAFTVPPTQPRDLVCNKRKLLEAEHLANMKAEKEQST